MTTLRRKLVRDMLSARWQFLAISLVAALGVALFHGSLVSQENQKESYRVTYARMRFADVWVMMDRAPRSVVRQVARLPGVLAVEGRLVVDLEMEQDAGRRPRVIGRLVSLPAGREPQVNQLRVVAGRPLADPPRREVLLEAAFAKEHGYRPGDRVYPVINDRRVAFTVAGIAASPEYIYPVQSKQFMIPTPETFGVMFAPQPEVEALLGMSGSINEVTLATEPGMERAVGERVAERLRAYGPQEPTPREEQPSNQLIQSDLEGNGPFLIVMPALFLGSAALAVSLVLARWVQAQRGQVGFLRASGFPPRAILAHYVEIGLVVGLIAGVLGVTLGHLMGLWLSQVYGEFLTMPYSAYAPRLEIGAGAFVLSLATCALGALGPALRAAGVPPAEAMRGQTPSQSRLLARVRLPLWLSLPVRNLLRRPLRSISTAASVAAAVILVMISGTFRDSMAEIESVYLGEIQRYDLTAGFEGPRSEAILFHLRGWPGVLRAEGTFELPVLVSRGNLEKETVAIGVPPDSRLRRLPGLRGGRIEPLPGTLLFSDELARDLQVEAGAVLDVAYAQNRRHHHAEARLPAGAVIRQPIGFPVYMQLDDLRRRFGAPLGLPPDAVTGVLLQVDPQYQAKVRDRLEHLDSVAMVQTKQELEDQILELTAYSKTFIGIMSLFGAGMALASIYTATDSVLWERTRELATLRTLGFGMGRLALFVTVENLIVAAAGAAGGIFAGRGVAEYLIRASETEGFTMRAVLDPSTYVLAFGGALGLTLLGQWPGLERVRRLDLAASIRVREE